MSNNTQLQAGAEMQGAILPGNSTTELRTFTVPEPGWGQVLIRMKASTICGSDIRAIFHPAVEAEYMQVVRRYQPEVSAPVRIERNAFYQRASDAFCVVMTGELRTYGNLILKKGVIT